MADRITGRIQLTTDGLASYLGRRRDTRRRREVGLLQQLAAGRREVARRDRGTVRLEEHPAGPVHAVPRRPCPARPPPAPAGAEAPAPGPHHRGHLDPQAARRGRPPAGRTTPGSSSRVATGPARRENRTLHRRGRRPERACRRPPRSPRPARRAGGRGCLVEYVRPEDRVGRHSRSCRKRRSSLKCIARTGVTPACTAGSV